MNLHKIEADSAVCRGCGMLLRGKAFHMGGRAFHPETGEECKKNFYGGFACSKSCDRKASVALEGSMPGASGYNSSSLSCFAQRHLDSNWPKNGENYGG